MFNVRTKEGVFLVEAYGYIGKEDYVESLIPSLEIYLKENEKGKFLFKIGDGFRGISFGAILEDVKTACSHFEDFSKIAIVSDHSVVRGISHLLHFFVPSKVSIYDLKDETVALKWLHEN